MIPALLGLEGSDAGVEVEDGVGSIGVDPGVRGLGDEDGVVVTEALMSGTGGNG